MPSGRNTTYDLTAGIPVNMDESIYMYSPDDSPLITGLNAQGGLILPSLPTDETKVEWMDEERLTPQSRLSVAATTGDTWLTVQSGERLRFSTSDILTVQGGDEHIQVTAYATTADTVDVTRGFNSTTATNYASGDLVIGVGTLLPEGSDPEAARSVDRTERFNYTQIFGPTKIDMSRTEQKRRKYGVANEWIHQTDQRIIENIIGREQALLYGKRYESTTTNERQMGGLKYWITTNVEATSTQITELTVQGLLEKCYNKGGVPDILMANPAALGDLDSLTDSNRVRVQLTDPSRGRVPAQTVLTRFGYVSVIPNRWVFPADAFLYSSGQAIRRIFDPMLFERLAKTGDSDQAQLVCEETLEFKGQQHAARFSALSYAYGW